MINSSAPRAVLLLADGTVFWGKPAGKIGTTTGEICFNTGMTGYQEVFTDPSYFGQLLVATNAHIGNYGTKSTEIESESIKISGLICKNYTVAHHRPQADRSIQEYLEAENLVGICDIDTRALVQHIRERGAMNGLISSDENLDLEALKSQLSAVPDMSGLELSSKVTTPIPYFLGNPDAPIRIAVLDYGVKKNILRCFAERNCYLKIFPATTPFTDLKNWNPDGFFLSNGPGDPAAMPYAVETVQQILADGKPVFGICLGHQLLAEAVGIPTYKMHHGHRGLNHPVKNLRTGRCEITSQNHGFSISEKAVLAAEDRLEITHLNLNDGTIEGIRLKTHPAFSVQYHPEAAPGPHDSRYLFDEFLEMVRAAKA